MFPPRLEIERNGRVIGEGGEGAFGGVVNALVLGAGCAELAQFVDQQRVNAVDNVQVFHPS
jgi:hypothetical protein